MTSVARILEQISTLSATQRAVLNKALDDQQSNSVGLEVSSNKSRESKSIELVPPCPHCDSHFVKKFGHFHTRKRYKCGICARTFTQLTKTPISKSHLPEKWNEFVSCCVEGLSLIKTADRLNIGVATAFRWRHKLMSAYASDQTLTGIAEADETFFLYSEKGSKSFSTSRKPRKRGGKGKTAGISEDQVPVVVGKDREGNIIVGVAGRGRISAKDIEKVLEEHIDSKATLCTDAHASFKAFAKANNLKIIQLNISKGKRVWRKKYHIQNVNSAHSSIKRWMVKFNGVSTKYLQNYMNWFCLLEETKGHSNQVIEFARKTIHPALNKSGGI